MSVNSAAFREAMGHLAGGVTVVTTVNAAGEPHGFTATAVCSVSLDPPLVLVCVGFQGKTLSAIRESGRYALNFLHRDGTANSARFSGSDDRKFDDLDWTAAPDGSPLLTQALAWAECAVEREIEAGDHVVFIGRVTSAEGGRVAGTPLIHFKGRYHTVTPLDE